MSYLFRALDIIQCKYEQEAIVTKYKLEGVETISKKVFMKVLKREYNRMMTLQIN